MDMNTVIGLVTSLLETHLTDPLGASRVGSYVFGPDQEINTTRMMPKVQVNDFNIETLDKSFGAPFQKSKNGLVLITFYNKRGEQYTSGNTTYINRSYTRHFLEEIQETLGSNLQTYALHGMTVGETDSIAYNPEKQIYMGKLPVTFGWRK